MAVLEIQNLNKSFGGLTVTKNLSISVQEGQIFGVIGPNGAGKSTLFNQISGYIRPDSGSIVFNDKNIVGKPPYELCREGIGRTFQIVKPFGSKTVLYNVAVGAFARTNSRSEALQKAEEVVKLVGLESRKDLLAKNLTIVDRKRLEVAKALATQPKLILLDEVLAGLTPSEVDEAVELIRRIQQSGVTVLMIEHVMRAVMALCERVLVISYGEPIAEGTPQEVTQNPQVISAYLGDDHHA
ncbi:ABC transporter ATP-binding protein [Paenibacillus validus]|uniref:ATP-binding cassette domain-containing protein n=1 Tax=Paenibacillus validus TaxID=44253 RepID=A0A7X2Z9N9_9BACL|nr:MULTISPECIES: ABC transporter ATP-binding protein [Paenibacillus]MED4602096.1 ABC transporter ATP-binding protein [Paenibacillus validus]MED4605844.1 ABC transporter ATP-binding protein [Paenibacillus validus]MUG70923.1 ATP-binding cassette domain-containing protein [Paenibacillus validus]